MKFKFCRDLDCPDWIISGIHLLSKFTLIKVRLLAKHILQVHLAELDAIDTPKLLSSNPKFDEKEIRVAAATIEWLISKAAGSFVAADVLREEFQQLGMPPEHANAIGKLYDENETVLKKLAQERTFRFGRLSCCDWVLKAGMEGEGVSSEKTVVEFQLEVVEGTRNSEMRCRESFEIGRDKFAELRMDVKEMLAIMDKERKQDE